jgi:hypothetical protein
MVLLQLIYGVVTGKPDCQSSGHNKNYDGNKNNTNKNNDEKSNNKPIEYDESVYYRVLLRY